MLTKPVAYVKGKTFPRHLIFMVETTFPGNSKQQQKDEQHKYFLFWMAS